MLLLCFLSLLPGRIEAEEKAEKEWVIANYNVENFLIDSTGNHFWYKAEAIAKVIVDMNGWNYPAIVGLEEVENDSCMKVLSRKLHRLHYDYVHYESPDKRGIDVAMLYDRSRVRVVNSRPIQVHLDGETTRDILYACCRYISAEETLHLMVCHLPSQLGGGAQTQWKRDRAYEVIQQTIDSVLWLDSTATIVVMGDMNSAPKENLRGVSNLCMGKKEGTHKYRGIWTWLDQFYCSEKMAQRAEINIYAPRWILEEDEKYGGMKPKRCDVTRYKWQKGYSDHLPAYLKVKYF